MLDTTGHEIDIQMNEGQMMPDDLQGVELSQNARTVLEKRYIRRDENGEATETIEQMFWRVASHVAKVECEWGGQVDAVAAQFYDLLTSKRFFPNSPTFTGARRPHRGQPTIAPEPRGYQSPALTWSRCAVLPMTCTSPLICRAPHR